MTATKPNSVLDGKRIGTSMQALTVDPKDRDSRRRAERVLGLTFTKRKKPKPTKAYTKECRALARQRLRTIQQIAEGRPDEPAVIEIVNAAIAIAGNNQKPWKKNQRLKKLERKLVSITGLDKSPNTGGRLVDRSAAPRPEHIGRYADGRQQRLATLGEVSRSQRLR
jgi:hypothetical protein